MLRRMGLLLATGALLAAAPANPANAQFLSFEEQRLSAMAQRLGYFDVNAFRSDREAAVRAQDAALARDTLNRPVEWHNPRTGNRGRTTVVQIGTDAGGRPCRVVEEELLVNGRLTRQMGMVCNAGSGWVGVQ